MRSAGFKAREKIKNKAAISQALRSMTAATSYELALKTEIPQTKVYHCLISLLDGHYVEKGKFTGKRNEVYWQFVKLYVEPSDKKTDWGIHYGAFYNLVRVGK